MPVVAELLQRLCGTLESTNMLVIPQTKANSATHNDVGGPHDRKRPQVRRSVDPIGRKDRGEDDPDNKSLEALKAFADALK